MAAASASEHKHPEADPAMGPVAVLAFAFEVVAVVAVGPVAAECLLCMFAGRNLRD